jgi:hypothetical protein
MEEDRKRMSKMDLIEQTNLAFDFIQKLYLEVSYLIKEMESALKEERFVIGKPGGYAVSGRKSAGLDAELVNFWLYKKLAVFFAPDEQIKGSGGQRETKIEPGLKILYFRIVLQDRGVTEPAIYSGVLYDIKNKAANLKKFEAFMGHFEYNDEKIFSNAENINYEDARISIKGKLMKSNLFDINSSDDIRKKIIEPTIQLYKTI